MATAQILLPGDIIPLASSSISKLGPGILQTAHRFPSSTTSSSSDQLLVATKAGQFGTDKTGKRVYVEGKGKRVRPRRFFFQHDTSIEFDFGFSVCAGFSGSRDRDGDRSTWRRLQSRHWIRPPCFLGRPRFRIGYQAKQTES